MKLKNNKGFTGEDVAISTVILIIFVSFIAMLFYNISISTKQIERKSKASQLAIQVIEAMKMTSFDNLNNYGTKTGTEELEYQDVTQDEIKELTSQDITFENGYSVAIYVEDYNSQQIVKILGVKVSYPYVKDTIDTVEIKTLLKKEISSDTSNDNDSTYGYNVTINYYDVDGNVIHPPYVSPVIHGGWNYSNQILDTITEGAPDGCYYEFSYAAGDPIMGNNIRRNQVVNLYYELSLYTDLTYTVRYLEEQTGREIYPSKTIDGCEFGQQITEYAIDIEEYELTSQSPVTIIIGTGDNVISFYYVNVETSPTPTPPTPTPTTP